MKPLAQIDELGVSHTNIELQFMSQTFEDGVERRLAFCSIFLLSICSADFSLRVRNTSVAVPATWSVHERLGHTWLMGASSSFLDFKVSLLRRPSTSFGIAQTADDI